MTKTEMEADLLINLLFTVDRIEKKLECLENSTTESVWMNPEEFSKLVGTTRGALQKAVQRGRIHGDALRNIGTAKRKHLRYHRTKAVDQYLKKLT